MFVAYCLLRSPARGVTVLYVSRLRGFVCTARDATDTEYPNNGLTPATKNRLTSGLGPRLDLP